MKEKRAKAEGAPGPQRWHYRSYSVHERKLPFGRRFEVRSPIDELVLFCRSKKSDPRLVFFADEKETQELFRFEPRVVRQFQRAFDAVDAPTGRTFGFVRKREYGPVEKMEWFILNADGEQLGLITETAPEPTFLRRIVPVPALFPKAWAVHWGQAVAGRLQPKAGLMGEKIDVDLQLDTRDEIDRRLVLGATVALRADQHHSDAAKHDNDRA